MVPSRIQARHAVSLLELTVTTLLIGILATTAVLRFGPVLHEHRAAGSARRLVRDLALARHSARNSNRAVNIIFDVPASRYTISPLLSASGATVSQSIRLAEGPSAATLQTANLGGDSVLIFNGFGIPDSGGSVVLRSGSSTATVTIDAATGAASLP